MNLNPAYPFLSKQTIIENCNEMKENEKISLLNHQIYYKTYTTKCIFFVDGSKLLSQNILLI
jgi:hypothetical protein